MNYLEATKSDLARFNNFVADFDWGDLLQSYEWGELKSRSGWSPVHLVAVEDGNIHAAASLHKRLIPHTNRCIIYVPRGPVMDMHDAKLVSDFSAFIRDTAIKHNAILVKIDPPVHVEDNAAAGNLMKSGFNPLVSTGFGGTQPKCVMQLDLARSEEDLLASFKPKWRYNIRLAERKGVTVDTNAPKSELPLFYAILRETCKRDGFLVRSMKYFEDMWDILVPAGYMRLAMTYYENRPIAGALVYKFGDKAWYTYGASSNEHRNVMPNHLMQWRLIQWANECGCKWYDFRGVSPNRDANVEDHLQGLNRFKEGFSPRFVEYLGEYDMVLSKGYYWMWTVGFPMVRKMIKMRSRSHRATADI